MKTRENAHLKKGVDDMESLLDLQNAVREALRRGAVDPADGERLLDVVESLIAVLA